ncbi:MAG: NUDIX hydrolase [Acidobacteriaceae bacterium]
MGDPVRPGPTDPQWLSWVKRLQAIAQTGLHFTKDHYDRERYEELRSIAAEMMAVGSGMPDSKKILELFRGEHGYATPKVEVRGAVVRNGQILLVREREDGGWTMPGGWADVGESPSDMVIREVKEESGYDVAPRKLAAVFDRNKHPHPPEPTHAYKLFFVCDLLGGEARPSFETPEVGFFSRRQLPPLSAARITAYQIEQMFEHVEHPDRPTIFD